MGGQSEAVWGGRWRRLEGPSAGGYWNRRGRGAGDDGRWRRSLSGRRALLMRPWQRRRRRRLTRSLANSVEDSPVKQCHDNTRDVERAHRRVDEKVGVVERAKSRSLGTTFGVVHTKRDRRRDRHRDDPCQCQRDVDAIWILVLGIFDRLSHREKPLHNNVQTIITFHTKIKS